VAASIRDRNGYCFGLEFLGLLPNDSAEGVGPDLAEMVDEPGELSEVESMVVGADGHPAAEPIGVVQGEDEILALFLERHEAYLHQKESEIKRLRHEIEGIRQSRREIEMLILRQVLGRSV
jgi:hypothetical protein